MPTSVPGSKSARVTRAPPRRAAPAIRRHRRAGFTLIELLVVVALIAVVSGVISLGLRDPSETQLEREGARLAALLDSARTEARASGLPASWEPRTGRDGGPGFRFVGLPPSAALPSRWLTEGVTAEIPGAVAVLLGPEPMIGAQRILLRLADRRLTLATDGLGPFAVVDNAFAAGR